MLLLFLIVILILGGWLLRRGARNQDDRNVRDGLRGSGIACFVLAALVAVIFVMMTATTYSDQVNNRADLLRLTHVTAIQNRQATTITSNLKSFLIAQYPQYEKSVIDSIVAKGPTLILLRFPTLQTSTVFLSYASDYKDLKERAFTTQQERAAVLASMDARERNWMTFFPPLLP